MSCIVLFAPFAKPQTFDNAGPTVTSLIAFDPHSQRDIRIQAGDLLEVSVFGVPDFKQEVRVSEHGDILLPLVGRANMAGLSLQQAQDTIAVALVEGGFFRDPEVTVLLKEFASHGITVLGEVERPGVYPALTTKRLFDLISISGGFNPKAGKTATITHSDNPHEQTTVNLAKDPAHSFESNVEVFPGDTILVSKAGIVYVVGDVVRPGGYIMENGDRMTLLQAVAMAQGVNRTAALGSAKLIRSIAGKPQEVKITLKGILSAKAADIDLLPEDILFVPGSLAKSAFKRGLDSALQIATSVAIYGAH